MISNTIRNLCQAIISVICTFKYTILCYTGFYSILITIVSKCSSLANDVWWGLATHGLQASSSPHHTYKVSGPCRLQGALLSAVQSRGSVEELWQQNGLFRTTLWTLNICSAGTGTGVSACLPAALGVVLNGLWTHIATVKWSSLHCVASWSRTCLHFCPSLCCCRVQHIVKNRPGRPLQLLHTSRSTQCFGMLLEVFTLRTYAL